MSLEEAVAYALEPVEASPDRGMARAPSGGDAVEDVRA
jgi:hypothetical protein